MNLYSLSAYHIPKSKRKFVNVLEKFRSKSNIFHGGEISARVYQFMKKSRAFVPLTINVS